MPEEEQTAADGPAGAEPGSREAAGPLERPLAMGAGAAVPLPAPGERRFNRKIAPGARWRHAAAWVGLALLIGSVYSLPRVTQHAGIFLPGSEPRGGEEGIAVILDPGHGGMDSGAVGQGVIEKELTLDIAMRVSRILAARRVGSRMTRVDDRYVPLEARVRFANALPGAIFVSIHFNDAPPEGRVPGKACGIETYYSAAKDDSPATRWILASLFGMNAGADGSQTADRPEETARAVREGELLAGCIQGALIANTAAADRGIKAAGLYVTRRVRGPAVLVEGGFVSHPQEAHLLNESAYRQKIAQSIAEGIILYLGAAQSPAPTPAPPRA